MGSAAAQEPNQASCVNQLTSPSCQVTPWYGASESPEEELWTTVEEKPLLGHLKGQPETKGGEAFLK